jgi:hypothetical protein
MGGFQRLDLLHDRTGACQWGLSGLLGGAGERRLKLVA